MMSHRPQRGGREGSFVGTRKTNKYKGLFVLSRQLAYHFPRKCIMSSFTLCYINATRPRPEGRSKIPNKREHVLLS